MIREQEKASETRRRTQGNDPFHCATVIGAFFSQPGVSCRLVTLMNDDFDFLMLERGFQSFEKISQIVGVQLVNGFHNCFSIVTDCNSRITFRGRTGPLVDSSEMRVWPTQSVSRSLLWVPYPEIR